MSKIVVDMKKVHMKSEIVMLLSLAPFFWKYTFWGYDV